MFIKKEAVSGTITFRLITFRLLLKAILKTREKQFRELIDVPGPSDYSNNSLNCVQL